MYVGKDIKIIAFLDVLLDSNLNSLVVYRLLFFQMRKRQRISRTEIGTKLEAAVLDEVSQAGSASNTARPLSFLR